MSEQALQKRLGELIREIQFLEYNGKFPLNDPWGPIGWERALQRAANILSYAIPSLVEAAKE